MKVIYIIASILFKAATAVDEDNVAVELNQMDFGTFLEAYDHVFIKFYATWCSDCQRLAPTWETFAKEIKAQGINIGVGSVDCTANRLLCREQYIYGFPIMRWFEKGQGADLDYEGTRTVDSFMEYCMKQQGKKMEQKVQEDDETDGEEDFSWDETTSQGVIATN